MSRSAYPTLSRRLSWPARVLGLVAAVLAVLMAWCGTASAATRTVTSYYDYGTEGTLRKTIANANSGDTIVFEPSMSGSIILSQGSLSITKDLTIDGDGRITISGDSLSRIFTVQDASLSLANLVLTNGEASEEAIGPDFGGAVYCELTSGTRALTLTGCRIANSRGDLLTGGVVHVLASDGNVTMTLTSQNTQFIDNGQSGLVYIGGNATGSLDATIADCRFQSNAGTGCWISPSAQTATVDIADSIFEDNGAAEFGSVTSAIRLYAITAQMAASIAGCTISNNKGGGPATGVGLEVWTAVPGSSLEVEKCRFIDNLSSGAAVGGMFLVADAVTNLRVRNCFFAGNETATSSGGGLGAALSSGAIFRLVNNTFSANVAQDNGAGVFLTLDSTVTAYLDNNIVYGNSLSGSGVGKDIYLDDHNATVYVRTCMFGPGSQDIYATTGDDLTLSANLTQDPMLRNIATGDLHLRANSPAIDAGRCAYYISILADRTAFYNRIAPDDDIDGDLRPEAPNLYGCDIGADEYTLHPLPLIMLLDE